MSIPAVPIVTPDERIAALYDDPRLCAQRAGLSYVTDELPGIRRRRCGRGFSYLDTATRRSIGPAVRARIAALAIPPAWQDVWICPDADGHILAVGVDSRGRKQYIYHERWRQLRDLLNFYRLISFGEHLPALRERISAQLRRRTLDRDQVVAAMLRIVDATAIRIGNEVYAEENDSFGLSTLTRRHVRVAGGTVSMSFRAKSGKPAELVLADRSVARVVGRLASQHSRRLFTVDRQPVDSAEVNAALLDWSGVHVTAKDFRTWRGTLTAFEYLEQRLADAGADAELPGAARRARDVLAALDAVSQRLGNTRAVAREHYVHPHVLSAYEQGTLAEELLAALEAAEPPIDNSEQRLLAFLRYRLEHDAATTPVLAA